MPRTPLKIVDGICMDLAQMMRERGLALKEHAFIMDAEPGLRASVSLSPLPAERLDVSLQVHIDEVSDLGYRQPDGHLQVHLGRGGPSVFGQNSHYSLEPWPLSRRSTASIADVLIHTGIPALTIIASRDWILQNWKAHWLPARDRVTSASSGLEALKRKKGFVGFLPFITPPYVVAAAILHGFGENDRARRLLREKADEIETLHSSHAQSLRDLASRL